MALDHWPCLKISDSGIPIWKTLLVDAPLALCGLNIVTSIPAHTMIPFTQRAEVSLDIGWCSLPCVMKNWVHLPSTSPALKCKYSLCKLQDKEVCLRYVRGKQLVYYGLEGLEHFVRPVMWHITFPPTWEISIFEVSNLCKVYSRLPASIELTVGG